MDGWMHGDLIPWTSTHNYCMYIPYLPYVGWRERVHTTDSYCIFMYILLYIQTTKHATAIKSKCTVSTHTNHNHNHTCSSELHSVDCSCRPRCFSHRNTITSTTSRFRPRSFRASRRNIIIIILSSRSSLCCCCCCCRYNRG